MVQIDGNVMRKIYLLLLLVFVVSCSRPVPQFVKGAEFQVSIKMSEAAKKEFLNSGETIKILAVFDGDRSFFSFGGFEKTAPFRDIVLGSEKIEIRPGEIAKFGPVMFSGKDFSDLRGGVYYVSLDVASGRRYFPKNILSCDTPSEISAKFEGKIINVNCGLIGEVIK